jgi:excisionase family DNA binding protein
MQLRINRLLSFEDICVKYGGSVALWEKIRPHLPVWTLHDGLPVYLESQVDDFLKAFHNRLNSSPEQTAPESPYLTTEQAAEYLKASVQSIYDWTKRGKLNPVPGRRGLFTRDALDRFAQTRRRQRKGSTAGVE